MWGKTATLKTLLGECNGNFGIPNLEFFPAGHVLNASDKTTPQLLLKIDTLTTPLVYGCDCMRG